MKRREALILAASTIAGSGISRGDDAPPAPPHRITFHRMDVEHHFITRGEKETFADDITLYFSILNRNPDQIQILGISNNKSVSWSTAYLTFDLMTSGKKIITRNIGLSISRGSVAAVVIHLKSKLPLETQQDSGPEPGQILTPEAPNERSFLLASNMVTILK
ncbi:hypothetical protein [Planctomicrobium sp. SH527]|uniref:hypothetical protein n=1 Tax=Planctomicrobium sp. SH527 TaxID=3448123 RepID=UPI003F5BECAD